MKAVEKSPHLFTRGKRGTYHVRRRIPAELQPAYPSKQREIVRSLRTADAQVAQRKMHRVLADIEADFEKKQKRVAAHQVAHPVARVTHITDGRLTTSRRHG